MDQADRLHLRAARRARNAGDRHADMGVGVLQRAFRHHPHHRLGDRAIVGDQVAGYAQQVLLGAVGIGDQAAVEDVGRTGHRGDRGRDQPAGAAFRRHDAQGAFARLIHQEPRVGFNLE